VMATQAFLPNTKAFLNFFLLWSGVQNSEIYSFR
jgi:hypothetical protein